jgi:hypothetical protein
LKGAAIGKTVARASRRQIELAMAWTQGTLGLCGRTAAAWCDTPLYQSANRLAHLQWFNCRGVDAWLVHVLFTGDAYTKPATEDEWKLAVREADRQLGLEGKPVQRAGYVTLPAVSRQQRVHDGGAPVRPSDAEGVGTTSRLGHAGQRRRDAGPAAPRLIALSDRIRGCLVGGAVGDALGAPVEFDSLDRIRKRFGPDGVTEFAEAYGRPGAITDDTQMTLFTAEGLIRAYVRQVNKGMCDVPSVVDHAYVRWLTTQGERSRRWTQEAPDGWLITVRGLHDHRAPGNTCISALRGPRAGTIEEPVNDSKGCGGVMRIAPVGLLGSQYSGDRFDLGCEVAALTHGHPSGYLASEIGRAHV